MGFVFQLYFYYYFGCIQVNERALYFESEYCVFISLFFAVVDPVFHLTPRNLEGFPPFYLHLYQPFFCDEFPISPGQYKRKGGGGICPTPTFLCL